MFLLTKMRIVISYKAFRILWMDTKILDIDNITKKIPICWAFPVLFGLTYKVCRFCMLLSLPSIAFLGKSSITIKYQTNFTFTSMYKNKKSFKTNKR